MFACFVLAALTLSGCANFRRPADAAAAAAQAQWQGRIAVKVLTTPPQAFSSDFELEGQASAGTLTLLSPIGTTVAQMQWAPGTAQLRHGNDDVRSFPSLAALAAQATGAEIPIAALFDWLHGLNTRVPGWEADLTQLRSGRLQAHRAQDSAPAVDLKIILER